MIEITGYQPRKTATLESLGELSTFAGNKEGSYLHPILQQFQHMQGENAVLIGILPNGQITIQRYEEMPQIRSGLKFKEPLVASRNPSLQNTLVTTGFERLLNNQGLALEAQLDLHDLDTDGVAGDPQMTPYALKGLLAKAYEDHGCDVLVATVPSINRNGPRVSLDKMDIYMGIWKESREDNSEQRSD